MAVTSDGSIALFHAHEYRIEWFRADNSHTTGTRIPYPWQRIPDDVRARAIDSTNTAVRQVYDSLVAKRAADSVRTGGPPVTAAAAGRSGRPTPPPKLGTLATSEDVPDFYPPTAQHAFLADGDNQLWVRHRIGEVWTRPRWRFWDVINRKGEVVDRVAVPANQMVVGFAAGGKVFTTISDAGTVKLVESRVR